MKNMRNRIIIHLKENLKDIIINALVIAFFVFASFYNFPFLIYKPGGTIALDSRIYLDGEKVELGDYNLAYVSVSRGNLINMLLANIINDWDLVKEDAMTLPDTDYDTTFKIEQIDLQNSISIAKYIAYQKADMQASISISSSIVYAIFDEADTDLQIMDELLMVDDVTFEMPQVNEYINSLPVGTEVSIKVRNDGKEYTRYAKVINVEGRNIIGIYLYHVYEVSNDPQIEIKSKKSEAGSSGGMMLTLAIYDALMPKDMTSGKKIVGTGTIELDGTIGSIGGVKYKLLGASKNKADIFFIPEENYEEAKKIYDQYKLKFSLVSVKTFDDVIDYLNSI